MVIKTQFDFGQTVYYWDECTKSILHGNICGIMAVVDLGNELYIEYFLHGYYVVSNMIRATEAVAMKELPNG